MSDDLLSFGSWIRRRRKALDLTQDDLAGLVGCSKDLIVKIEGDARRPSKQVAELLACALSLTNGEIGLFIRAARAELTADQLPAPTTSVPQPTLNMPVFASVNTSAIPQSQPGGTVTFLFTDIEGSTQLWERHPQAMKVSLAQHHALLRQAIETHAGVVFQIIGDAFCAAFATAPAALHAALDAQRALRDAVWGSTGPIRVRMALHTATIALQSGDYPSGPHFNRLARLLSAGHGDQVLLSAATHELLHEHLPPDVSFRDLGAHQLKNLSQSAKFVNTCFEVKTTHERFQALYCIAEPNHKGIISTYHSRARGTNPLTGKQFYARKRAQRLDTHPPLRKLAVKHIVIPSELAVPPCVIAAHGAHDISFLFAARNSGPNLSDIGG